MSDNFKDGFIKYGLNHGYIKPPKKEKENMKKENEEIIDYGSCANCDKKLDYLGALLWGNSGYVCNDCDMSLMVVPNLKSYYGIKDDE